MRTPSVLIGAGLAALMLLLGACSGDEDTSTPDTTESSGATEAPDTTDPAAEAATTTTMPPATTTTTMPAPIPASEPSIVAGEYEFAVTGAGIVSAVPTGGGLGMVPTNFGGGDQVLIVEFELLSGDAAGFATLEIMVTDGEGLESSPFLATAEGITTNLESTTMIGSDAQYEFAPGSTHSWAYAVPGTSGLALVFPSGEVVDLSPILP